MEKTHANKIFMRYTVYSYVIMKDNLSEVSQDFVNGILKYEGEICER